MANDNGAWRRTVIAEINQFRSLRPRPGRVFRFTPMPPDLRAAVTKELGVWPVPQKNRDSFMSKVAKKMAWVAGPWRHGPVPEPDASRAAAAAEAEAFAAASAYAAAKDLTTDEGRADVFKMYVKELWTRSYSYADRYAKSRPQAAAAAAAFFRARTDALPPDLRAAVTKGLGVWPVPQKNRDSFVSKVAKKMAWVAGPWHHGPVPEPDASRGAAAVEAKAFAAASAYAAAKDLTTDDGRADVFKMYVKELWTRSYSYADRYAKSRPQAAAAAAAARAAGPSAPRAPAAAPEE